MALRCAICSSDQKVETVCHHCGKPLCDTHKVTVYNDKAFADSPFKRFAIWSVGGTPEQVALLAYHCPQCKWKHHFFAIVIESIRQTMLDIAHLLRLTPNAN